MTTTGTYTLKFINQTSASRFSSADSVLDNVVLQSVGTTQAAEVTQDVTVQITGANDPVVITSSAQSGAVIEDETPTQRITNGDFANLVTNGSINNWTVTGSSQQVVAAVSPQFKAVDFGTEDSAAGGAIAQTVQTVQGQTYALTFDYAPLAGQIGAGQSQSLRILVTDGPSVLLDETLTRTAQNNLSPSLENFSLNFMASGSNAVVKFIDTSAVTTNIDARLDNVSVLPTIIGTTRGAVTFTDADFSDVHTASFTGTSAYGTFSLGTITDTITGLGGKQPWSFTLNNANAQSLASNQVVNEAFTISVTDSKGSTQQQTVNISITGTNDAPTVTATQTVQATEDTAVQVTVAGADVDSGDTLTYTAGTASKGLVTGGMGGVFTYTPNLNTNGLDSFVVTVTDRAGATAQQTVSLNVAAVNDAPVAMANALAATEDTAVTYTAAQLLGNDTDVEGQTLRIASVTSGTGGTATLNTDGTVTFTPTANFNGPASFTYVATDGSTANALSNSATVTVNVAPVSDPDSINTNATLAANGLTAQGNLFVGTGISGNNFVVATDAVDVPRVEIGLRADMRFTGQASRDLSDATLFFAPKGESLGTPNANATLGDFDDTYARWNFTYSINADTAGQGGKIGDNAYSFVVSKVMGSTVTELTTLNLDTFLATLPTATAQAVNNGSLLQDSLNLRGLLGNAFDANELSTYQIDIVANKRLWQPCRSD